MDVDRPMATLRLASDNLDIKAVSRILLTADKFVDVKSKKGVWLATTDANPSLLAETHLREMVNLVLNHLTEVRSLVSELEIDFSLLVFDPSFRIDSLSRKVVSSATELGKLTIELPSVGKEIVFSGAEATEYAV